MFRASDNKERTEGDVDVCVMCVPNKRKQAVQILKFESINQVCGLWPEERVFEERVSKIAGIIASYK